MTSRSSVFAAALLSSVLSVAPSMAAEKAQTVQLSPEKSTIGWLGKKVTGQHNGTIRLSKGQIELAKGEIQGGAIEIDMNSIVDEDLKDPEYNAKLINHLKSDDFFNAVAFPKSEFKITQVKKKKGAEGATHEITGELTLKGQTHPVTFPAKVTIEGNQASAQGKVKIDRTLWNVRYGSGKFFKGLGDKMINDQFELDLNVVGSI